MATDDLGCLTDPKHHACAVSEVKRLRKLSTDLVARLYKAQQQRGRLIEAWPTYQIDGRVYFDAEARCWKTQGRYECFESREAAVLAAAGIEAKRENDGPAD